MKLVLSMLLGVVPCLSQFTNPTPDPPAMNDADVVQMVQAKMSENSIILAVSQCEPHFQLEPGFSRYMLEAGVNYTIIKAMAAKQAGLTIPIYSQPQVEPQAAPQATLREPHPVLQTAPQVALLQTTDATKIHGDHHILKGLAFAAITAMCVAGSLNPDFDASGCQQNGVVMEAVEDPAAQGVSAAPSRHIAAKRRHASKTKTSKKSK